MHYVSLPYDTNDQSLRRKKHALKCLLQQPLTLHSLFPCQHPKHLFQRAHKTRISIGNIHTDLTRQQALQRLAQ